MPSRDPARSVLADVYSVDDVVGGDTAACRTRTFPAADLFDGFALGDEDLSFAEMIDYMLCGIAFSGRFDPLPSQAGLTQNLRHSRGAGQRRVGHAELRSIRPGRDQLVFQYGAFSEELSILVCCGLGRNGDQGKAKNHPDHPPRRSIIDPHL
jgi:hypothetical protein